MSGATSQPLYNERDAGLLLVFADTGDKVTLDEFHDWYENEHIPLRTSKFPEFLSAARYKVKSSEHQSGGACDGTSATFKAPWSAVYSISSNAVFADSRYTALREHRSAREADVVKRLAVLDRRIYRLVYDSAAEGAIDISVDSRDGIGPAPAMLQAEPREQVAPVIVATSVTPAPDNVQAYNEWQAKEHVAMLKKVPGWRRTRRFELLDAIIVGQAAAPDNADAKQVPRLLAIHEYDDPAFASTPEYTEALSTPWRAQVIQAGIMQRERRFMHLHRAFTPDAAMQAQNALASSTAPITQGL